MRPELLSFVPKRTKTCFMCSCVLDDQSINPLGVRQGKTESHRAAVILHEEHIVFKAQFNCEVIDDLGNVVERVWKSHWGRPVTVPEAWVIRRNHMVSRREPLEERVE